MKTVLSAFLVAAALGLAACDPDSSDGVGAVCEPSTFTTANPAGVEDYCIDLMTAYCDRAFSDCTVELGMTSAFANAAECIDYFVSACTSTSWSTTGLNPACAASCLRTVRTADCSLFESAEPTACDAATGTVGTSPVLKY